MNICNSDHRVPGPGEQVRVGIVHCEHGEVFINVNDLLAWLYRIDVPGRPDMNMTRDFIAENLTGVALYYDLREDGR